MKEDTGTPPASPSTPDAATLARCYPGLSATEALQAWRKYESDLAGAARREKEASEWFKLLERIPQPPQWPAKLDDFYRLIVRAKDKTEAQPRFKRFLRHRILKEQKEIRQRMQTLTEEEMTGKATASQPKASGPRLTEEALQEAVDRLFNHYKACKTCAFQPGELPLLNAYFPNEWTLLALEYHDWWESEKHAAKVRAGHAGAVSPKRKRKTTEQEAVLKTVAAITGPEDAATATKAKKRVSALRKRETAS
jgi:hypothetical protein